MELVVGMVLLGVLSAVVISGTTGALSGAADTASTTSGKARAAEAATRFGADLRAARSHGRDGAGFIDPVDLRAAIQTDGQLRDLDGNLLDWRDITEASTFRLTFQSDIVDEAPGSRSIPECVTWSLEGGRTWFVRRITRAYVRGCAGGGGRVLEDDALSEPTSAVPRPGTAGTQPIFLYVLADPNGAAGCRPRMVTSASGADRNRVTSIRIDFSSLARMSETSGRAQLRSEITLRSRSGADYQFGLGCDE